jgi:Domain of unknown function (DUF4349)
MTTTRHDRGRSPQSVPWRRLAIASVVILLLTLAACGGGAAIGDEGAPAPVDQGAQGRTDTDGEAPAGDEGANGGDVANGTVSFEDLANRQIIKTGEITLEVQTVSSAVGEIRAMALQLGGYVGGSQAGTADDAATLTLRIPAGRFEDALQRLHDMDGDVTAEATREQDVTGSVVDLEARIRNLEASEAQYRALLDRATDIEDILTVQARLDEVRGQIEQLQAQLDQLSELASLATLTVTVVPAAAPVEETTATWDPAAIFDSAVAALVGLGQAVAAAAIWLVILGLPLAIVAGIVVWIVLRLAPAAARRRPTGGQEQASGPAE